MRTEKTFEYVLEGPFINGADELFIISGYATATFANQHLECLKRIDADRDFKINLIIGMPGKRSDHPGFLRLKKLYKDSFNCYYIEDSPYWHTKIFSWFKEGKPLIGYSGSANYSQYGFLAKDQINQVCEDNPADGKALFDGLVKRAVKIEEYTKFDINEILQIEGVSLPTTDVFPGDIRWEIPDIRVSISFLAKNGTLPERSGLNWGQRPEEGREPNQAYLSIKKDARKEGFLPPSARTFTLITDDGLSFDCVVAQEGRKAIHSTFDNSELGRYIRKRLQVPEGSLVKTKDLVRYGRTDFTIQKINEETFLFDFSVKNKATTEK